jgi:hypothetical protein
MPSGYRAVRRFGAIVGENLNESSTMAQQSSDGFKKSFLANVAPSNFGKSQLMWRHYHEIQHGM